VGRGWRPHPRPLQVREAGEVIRDADLVQHAAEAAQGHAVAIGAAEAAELAAALDVGLQVEEEAGDALLPQGRREGR